MESAVVPLKASVGISIWKKCEELLRILSSATNWSRLQFLTDRRRTVEYILSYEIQYCPRAYKFVEEVSQPGGVNVYRQQGTFTE
jgi:hypothetical protein